MATNRDLLKEAIADAKAVKEMAIANAKLALEESFTPHLKSMLSTKLQEMEEEEDKIDEATDPDDIGIPDGERGEYGHYEEGQMAMYDEDYTTTEKEDLEELDIEELLSELNEEEAEEDMEEEAEEADEDMESETEAESMDLEDMSEEDLKSFIEDVIADMVEAGELEAGEEMESEDMEDMEDGEMETEEEEEVNIDELLAEIDSMDEMYHDNEDDMMEERYSEEEPMEEGLMDKITKVFNKFIASSGGVETLKKEIPFKVLAGKRLAKSGKIDFTEPTDADIKDIISKIEGDGGSGRIEIKGGKLVYTSGSKVKGPEMASTFENQGKELDEAYSTIKTLRSELNEINLLNAKLLYTNKIFKGKNLTESQKVEVLENFDKTTTVKEVKLVYETLLGAIKTKKNRISENLGSASKSMGTTKKPIIEANDAFSRMREIAFYSTKH